jgi:hypothetical protein
VQSSASIKRFVDLDWNLPGDLASWSLCAQFDCAATSPFYYSPIHKIRDETPAGVFYNTPADLGLLTLS